MLPNLNILIVMKLSVLLQRNKPGPRPKPWHDIESKQKQRVTASAMDALKKVAEERDTSVTSVAASIIHR